MSESGRPGLTGLRIAHLIESAGPGGAERVVAYLARHFQDAGSHSLVVLPSGGEDWLAHQLKGSGVTLERVRLREARPYDAIRDLLRLFRKHEVDLAHSHEFAMGVYGAWAAWRAGIPHVITMHGHRYYAERWRRRLGLRSAVALSGQIVAVSTRLARHLRRDLWIPSSQVRTIWNGVPKVPAIRSTLREELGLGAGDPILLAVGNLYPVKGHRYLLHALAALRDRHPGAHVVVAGRGQLAFALEARARELGVAERVHLLGLRSDIPNLLAGADLFVLPSLDEGLPLALLEAMHAGLPVVASDVGEVRAALAGGDAGMLVPRADPRALADAIGALLDSPERAAALGRRAEARAAAEYDLSVMAARYAAVYGERLVGREAGRAAEVVRAS